MRPPRERRLFPCLWERVLANLEPIDVRARVALLEIRSPADVAWHVQHAVDVVAGRASSYNVLPLAELSKPEPDREAALYWWERDPPPVPSWMRLFITDISDPFLAGD